MALSPDITELLIDWSRGDRHVQEQLLPLIYAELHAIAARYMGRERAGHTLQVTDLVHDAYLRLIDQKRVQWQNRAHFFAIASQMMRRILVDHARRHLALKHGGGTFTISLDEAATIAAEQAGELVGAGWRTAGAGEDRPPARACRRVALLRRVEP